MVQYHRPEGERHVPGDRRRADGAHPEGRHRLARPDAGPDARGRRTRRGQKIASYIVPTRAHLAVNDGQEIAAGTVLVRIPRDIGKTRDITGGLPRVTELFEARSPSDPAMVSEIDGIVSFGAQKRGSREVIVTSHDGKDIRKYPIPLGKHVLVQDNDVVRAGERLSDGAIDPHDVLRIKGVGAVQEYLVNEIQEVYRIQGVKINDKHIEIIVRQMMQKVRIVDSGDTKFLEGDYVDKLKFEEENESLRDKVADREQGGLEVQERAARLEEEGARDERRPAEEGEEGGRVPGRRAGDVRAGAARDHLRGAVHGQLHLRGIVPGDHEGADRRGDRGEGGQPARVEGKRHHGSPDSGRDGAEALPGYR